MNLIKKIHIKDILIKFKKIKHNYKDVLIRLEHLK